MTKLMEQALSAVEGLSEEEQDAIAEIILAELEDERRWEESFAKSQDSLSNRAAKAREDRKLGRCRTAG